MAEPLTDAEIDRIRRDFAAADKAENWLTSTALPWLASKWPHAATALVTALAAFGIHWSMQPAKAPDAVPDVRAKEDTKPTPIKLPEPK